MKNRIKHLRKQNSLTMQALADKVGTTASQINKLEKGERRLTAEWMYRLADALGVTPIEIFPEAKQKSSDKSQENAPDKENALSAPVLNHKTAPNVWQFGDKELMKKLPKDIAPALVQIKQDDLEPDVSRGDYVFINQKDTTPSPAGVFVTIDKENNYHMKFCKAVYKDGIDYIQTIDVEKTTSNGQAMLKKIKALKPASSVNIVGRILAHWHWL